MNYAVSLVIHPAAWAALGMLVSVEVVLGINDLLFTSILTNKDSKRNASGLAASALAQQSF